MIWVWLSEFHLINLNRFFTTVLLLWLIFARHNNVYVVRTAVYTYEVQMIFNFVRCTIFKLRAVNANIEFCGKFSSTSHISDVIFCCLVFSTLVACNRKKQDSQVRNYKLFCNKIKRFRDSSFFLQVITELNILMWSRFPTPTLSLDFGNWPDIIL